MIDAGTVAEADILYVAEVDILYLAEVRDNTVVGGDAEDVAWDDVVALEGGVVVGTGVEADELEIFVGTTEDVSGGVSEVFDVDVDVVTRGILLEVELGLVEDAVVDGGTEVELLDVDGVTTGGGTCRI